MQLAAQDTMNALGFGLVAASGALLLAQDPTLPSILFAGIAGALFVGCALRAAFTAPAR